MPPRGGSTVRSGRCSHCRDRSPSTHVVKWPPRSVLDERRRPMPGIIRRYVCAAHSGAIVAFQRRAGLAVRAYRYRRLPPSPAAEIIR